ncbi:hypothetical protein FOG18_10310 [Legionella israelensis]|uniref:hypothetical protein n=1 Tax=Legionella israelensis TaxID=454 RepID=UPI00117D0F32|nr:hypothetical protein [Legionella israelensis]QDP72926.1 hypothetical protein FOG18_10310 [Legionella israelensis]
MGKPNKSNDCQLYIQSRIPTEKDSHLLEKTDAAYVVTHDYKLFYVTKADIKKSGTDKINKKNKAKIEIQEINDADTHQIIEQLKYTSHFEKEETTLACDGLTAKQLSTISANSEHVHRPGYVKQLVHCFKKVQLKDQFSVKDREFYMEAIKYFGDFIQHLQKDIVDQNLDISHFLMPEDADVIVNGYEQLQRLLPTDGQNVRFRSLTSGITSFYSKILDFNNDFRTNKACKHIMDEIKTKMNIQVRPDQGTRRQKILIAHLKSECEKYKKHLNIEMGRTPDDSNPIDETVDTSLAAKKFNKVQGLITTLNDNTQSATARITRFTDDFNAYKDQFKEHRDGPFIRFIKNVGFALSSFFFGAGLFYSKFRKGSYDFTQSHGEVLNEKLQTQLDNYEEPEFVQFY